MLLNQVIPLFFSLSYPSNFSAVLIEEQSLTHPPSITTHLGDLYQPHKDAMLLIRDSMLEDFGLSLEVLMQEQWLDKLIKCECLRTVCDHVANVLNDMLSVSSGELGSVLRKLRFTYKQSFDQMHMSARQLHYFYVDTKQELESCRKELASVRVKLSNKVGSSSNCRLTIDTSYYSVDTPY